MYFSGSSDADSVFLTAVGVPIGPAPPTTILGTTVFHPEIAFGSPGATIDGVHISYWAFQLGGQVPGYLELLDATGNVLMEQDITGYIQITSYQEFGSRFNSNGNLNLNWSASGTFSISPTPQSGSGPIPTPEPGSELLVGLGILGALIFGRRTESALEKSLG